MNPDSMSGCVYKNGLPEVVAMIFSVSISFVDTVLAPGDFKKIMKKKGATFAQEIRPKRRNACNSQGNDVRMRGVAVVNHCAAVNLLRIVDLLRRSISSPAGSFGSMRAPSFELWRTFRSLRIYPYHKLGLPPSETMV